MTPIPCQEAVRRLWDYLDGALDRGDHRAVEDHLAFCLRCCGELEFARELRRLLGTKARVGMPTDVRARLEGFIDDLGDPFDAGASP